MNDIVDGIIAAKAAKDAEGEHVIRLGVGRPPKAQCSCTWETDPMEDLFALGTAAFDHARETGHVLRSHPGSDV